MIYLHDSSLVCTLKCAQLAAIFNNRKPYVNPYFLVVYRVELWKNDVSYTDLTMTQWLEVGFPASVHDLPAILAQKNKS